MGSQHHEGVAHVREHDSRRGPPSPDEERAARDESTGLTPGLVVCPAMLVRSTGMTSDERRWVVARGVVSRTAAYLREERNQHG